MSDQSLLLPIGDVRHIAVHGHAIVLLLDPERRVLRLEESDNLVVNGGLDQLVKRIAGIAANPLGYMALGSSTTASSPTQTSLVTEAVGGVRQAVTAVLVSPGQLQLTALWTASQNSNTTINEVGLFDSNAAGVMFSRLVLQNSVFKDQQAQLQVLYTITFTSS